MKHTLLTLLFVWSITLIRGQNGEEAAIAVSAAAVDSIFVVNITDPDLDLGLHTLITNNTDETIQLKWVRTVKEMPGSWESYICIDNFLCFFPESDTNFDPDNEIDDPLSLAAGASLDMAVRILPQTVMGDGEVEVGLALTSKPDSIFSTINFTVVVRDITSSTSSLQARDIRVFPNPASNYLMLTEYSQISRVDLYSMLGRRMQSFEIVDDRSLDISELPDGMYLVNLIDRFGRPVKTTRLLKQLYRP